MLSITGAAIRYYRDNQQYQTIIEWSDGSRTVGTVARKPSCFLMRPSSMELGTHLEQLFKRAERDGIKYRKEIW